MGHSVVCSIHDELMEQRSRVSASCQGRSLICGMPRASLSPRYLMHRSEDAGSQWRPKETGLVLRDRKELA